MEKEQEGRLHCRRTKVVEIRHFPGSIEVRLRISLNDPDRTIPNPWDKLTPRQKEIVALMLRGYTTPQMAEELFLSQHTVKNHVQNIFQCLNVSSRFELVKVFT